MAWGKLGRKRKGIFFRFNISVGGAERQKKKKKGGLKEK